MEAIKGQVEVREGRLEAIDEYLVHVNADLLDVLGLAAVGDQVLLEGIDGGRVPPLGSEQQGPVGHVHEQGDVVLAAPTRGVLIAIG
ncbi:MAG: hypothetical protein ABSH53_06740 [Holophaga sp.]